MTLSGKIVLVTGATGFLGGHLCQRLASEGAQIRALARRPERDRYIRDLPSLDVVQGDITDANRMREIIRSVDVVFHLAAATGGDIELQRRVNIAGTHHVMQAVVEAGVTRVVHVSSIAAYGYRKRSDVTEKTPPDSAADPYHTTKLEAESTVRTICTAGGLDYAIIRPGMVYGPRSNTWTKTMFQIAKRKPTIWLGDGSGSCYAIYVDDVVDMMVTLATHPSAVGETFNCTPDPSPTWREFLGSYAALVGHDRWLGIPPWAVKPVVWPVAKLVSEHNRLKDLPDLASFVTSYLTFRMDKAKALLDWQPQVKLQEGIQRCVPYLREKGLLE